MMHARTYTFLLSFSSLLLFSSTGFAQSDPAVNANPFPNRSEANCPPGAMMFLHGPQNGAAPEGFAAAHPRMATAFRFLRDASFRDSIEAPMTIADKQTIETDVAQIKSDIATLTGLRPQFKAARQAHDTATIHSLFHTARPLFVQMRDDRKQIIEIIMKYKSISKSEGGNLLEPVYPNPVHLGGAGATVTYHLPNSGPVQILVTDAAGNIVQNLSKDETAGTHTLTIGESLTKPGAYYVTVIAAGVKSTQKVAAVE